MAHFRYLFPLSAVFLLGSCDKPGPGENSAALKSGKSIVQKESQSVPRSPGVKEFETSAMVGQSSNIVVEATDSEQLVTAKNSNVVIKGSGQAPILISGDCRSLVIEGENHEIYCESTQQIDISGNNNLVKIGSVKTGMVTGNGNKVLWENRTDEQQPGISTTGQANELRQLVATDQRF